LRSALRFVRGYARTGTEFDAAFPWLTGVEILSPSIALSKAEDRARMLLFISNDVLKGPSLVSLKLP
jgi:hypothetical protein